MITRISLILLFLIVVPAVFIYYHRLRHKTRGLLFLLPNAALLAMCAYFMANDSDISRNANAIGIYLIVCLLITVPEIFYSTALALSLACKAKTVKRCFLWPAMALSVAADTALITGYIACFTVIDVKHHEFASHYVPPAFDGYRIVHISDLHLGTFHMHPATVDKIVSTINAQHGDAIAFTGDLVNFSQDEMWQFIGSLKQLKAHDGVFSVLGNHDYLNYVRYADDKVRQRRMAKLIDFQHQLGWHLLLNESRCVRRGNDSIFIIGSENDGLPPFPAKGNLRKALDGVPYDAFKVLLSHDPTQWRRKVLPKTNIQLTLSGHTHAGQIKIWGQSPSAVIYNEWDGMYHATGGRALFISSGIGEALIPFRLGAWPKIDIITLRSKK